MSADDSHLTVEFEDHFVMRPTISFMFEVDYTHNSLEKRASKCPLISNTSGDNPHFLTVQEMREMKA